MLKKADQIKLGAILSYSSIAVNIITGLLYTPWMVETIGKSQYGLYTLANSVITLFLMDFGLSAATGRYLSKYNAEGDRDGAQRFLGAVYKLYLMIDAVILGALVTIFFLVDRIYVNLTPAELEQFRVVYAISAIFSVINFPFVTFNGILTAYEKFIPLKTADLLYRLGNVCFTVMALLKGYGLYALVTVHASVGLLVLIFKFVIIRKNVQVKPDFRNADKGIYKDIFGFSLWVTVSSLAARLVFNITPSILGIVANSAAIAVFGIVTTIEGYTSTIEKTQKEMDELNEKGALHLDINGEAVELTKEDLLIDMAQMDGYVSEGDNEATVVLDTNLTEELIEEGFVREIISKIQTMRKEAGFEVMDKIAIYETGSEKVTEILNKFGDTIKEEVLATDLVLGETKGYVKEWNINGENVVLGVEKQ